MNPLNSMTDMDKLYEKLKIETQKKEELSLLCCGHHWWELCKSKIPIIGIDSVVCKICGERRSVNDLSEYEKNILCLIH
jgi:hypothetical protein